MLDINLLRHDLDAVSAKLATRGKEFDFSEFLEIEKERKRLQTHTQELQASRNALSKKIGQLKATGQDATQIMAEVSGQGDQLKASEHALSNLLERLHCFLSELPNLPAEEVPYGQNEHDNIEQKRWGEPRDMDFEIKDHVDIGEHLGLLDLNGAAKISGARFSLLRGDIAKMHRALVQLMLDMHTEQHGYSEVYTPYLVNADSLFGTGQLPKFEDDLFKLPRHEADPLYLIPTAEVPLTNMVRDAILDTDTLPIKLVSHTPCFRSEAGSYGKDTRGMIRQHQFDKVELVQIVHPDMAIEAHEALTTHAEAILEQLQLPYRRVLLCTGDMGFSALKTYDLEVWLPGQSAYREISSCSSFGDFQARRMHARFRDSKDKKNKPSLVYTVNGSGLAVGRTLVAVLENYQNSDGSVSVPDVLQPYMGGLKKIEAVV